MIFIVNWIYYVIKEARFVAIKKFKKIYLLICLCNNKTKFKREKEKILIEEENEILREDFNKCIEQILNKYSTAKTERFTG